MNKALFLDRDGVINVDKNYLFKIDDFEFIDGIFDLCLFYQSLNFKIFVVTNQSGISRGFYNNDQFLQLTQWMINIFMSYGIAITQVYYCPHHPDIDGECDCRKPNPGMILRAANDYDIDLKNSIMIGDKERDIESALNAGLITTYLYDATKTVKISKASKIINNLNEIISDK